MPYKLVVNVEDLPWVALANYLVDSAPIVAYFETDFKSYPYSIAGQRASIIVQEPTLAPP